MQDQPAGLSEAAGGSLFGGSSASSALGVELRSESSAAVAAAPTAASPPAIAAVPHFLPPSFSRAFDTPSDALASVERADAVTVSARLGLLAAAGLLAAGRVTLRPAARCFAAGLALLDDAALTRLASGAAGLGGALAGAFDVPFTPAALGAAVLRGARRRGAAALGGWGVSGVSAMR